MEQTVAEMRELCAAEKRRNIQERFGMAVVMQRLLDLKRSLDRNAEGDRDLRATVTSTSSYSLKKKKLIFVPPSFLLMFSVC